MKDVFGNELEVGDIVIYGKLTGRSSFTYYKTKVLSVKQASCTLDIPRKWNDDKYITVRANVIKISKLDEAPFTKDFWE